MTKPVLMAVDEQIQELAAVQQELLKRYAADYEVVCHPSTASALEQLEALRATGAQVIILLAAQQMRAMTGIDFLAQAHELHPRARRVLLIPFGNRSASKPILRSISLGQIDHFAVKPGQGFRAVVDEQFHRLITELLEGWQRQQRAQSEVITIVGKRQDAHTYEMRDLLQRSGLPFGFHEPDSDEGRALLEWVGHPAGPFPVFVRFDGQVFVNPPIEELAVALGVRHSAEEGLFDLAIVGAGPAGLSAAVYGASEGLRTIVVDRETIGGQAGTSALIRNYLGFPLGISGAELTSRALDQAWSFGADTSVLREAINLRMTGDEHILVFANGTEIVSRTIVLAMGASYTRLGIPSLETLVGAGVFYGGGVTEAQAMSGQHVFVAGAGNSAGQAAVHLARYTERVTMLVRGNSLAATMSDYLVKEIAAQENIEVRLHTQIVDGSGRQRLEELVLQDSVSGTTETVPATALFVLIGAQPRTEWLPPEILRDERGFILTGPDLVDAKGIGGTTSLQRPPLLLETSIPGIFAAGDVRHGSVKRVAAAVGEGGMAIQSVHQYLALR
jgi:thioredoxin reductase (NADPH)